MNTAIVEKILPTVATDVQLFNQNVVIYQDDNGEKYVSSEGVDIILGMDGRFSTSKNSKYIQKAMTESGMNPIKSESINYGKAIVYKLEAVLECAKFLVQNRKAKDILINNLLMSYRLNINYAIDATIK